MTTRSTGTHWTSTTPTFRSELGRRRGPRKAVPLILALVLAMMFASAAMSAVRAGEGPSQTSTTTYIVQAGDSLWSIASHVAPKEDPRDVVLWIMQHNGLSNATLQPGQVLIVPAGR
ncbi:MAG: LysM peptidoglycan-binding domain-containing protein [Alicyclobacillus sp.]|nr:LysM peptidoglycan-binding domain-containing protein [Alicyclobacillus sp.]